MQKYLFPILCCTILLTACNTIKTGSAADKQLEGEFSYRADVALFYVCSADKRYPVKGNEMYLAMERAYLKLPSREPGQPVYSVIEGHFEDGARAEGSGTETYLVVDRFIRFEETKDCN